MTSRQLVTPDATFALFEGQPTQNQDVFQTVSWAPLSPTFNTKKLRAYFEDTVAGEQLAASVYETLVSRGATVFKNWT